MKEFCVDLELARELKEAGFPQETLFYFVDGNITTDVVNEIEYDSAINCPDFNAQCSQDCSKCKYGEKIEHKVYSAPFSDEIIKELPRKLFGCHLSIDRTGLAYYVWYVPIGTDVDKRPKDFVPGNMGYKLSTALARMWLHLKKEGYIK